MHWQYSMTNQTRMNHFITCTKTILRLSHKRSLEFAEFSMAVCQIWQIRNIHVVRLLVTKRMSSS